jgi:hypothetical protein
LPVPAGWGERDEPDGQRTIYDSDSVLSIRIAVETPGASARAVVRRFFDQLERSFLAVHIGTSRRAAPDPDRPVDGARFDTFYIALRADGFVRVGVLAVYVRPDGLTATYDLFGRRTNERAQSPKGIAGFYDSFWAAPSVNARRDLTDETEFTVSGHSATATVSGRFSVTVPPEFEVASSTVNTTTVIGPTETFRASILDDRADGNSFLQDMESQISTEFTGVHFDASDGIESNSQNFGERNAAWVGTDGQGRPVAGVVTVLLASTHQGIAMVRWWRSGVDRTPEPNESACEFMRRTLVSSFIEVMG